MLPVARQQTWEHGHRQEEQLGTPRASYACTPHSTTHLLLWPTAPCKGAQWGNVIFLSKSQTQTPDSWGHFFLTVCSSKSSAT